MVTVLLAAIVLVGCGARTAIESPIVELAINPSGVTIDGQPVSMAQLDAQLTKLAGKGERLRLTTDWRTASPSPTLPYSDRQIERATVLQAQVLAAADRAGVTVITFNMPIAGEASPSAAASP